MIEHKWIQKLTQFQAFCRGYLMRKDLSLVRTQFEDVVREIDGGLDHLHWIGNIIPKPHFTDTESLLLQYGRSKNQSHGHLDESTRGRIDNMDCETPVPPSEVLVPEKDKAPETANSDYVTPLDEESVVRSNVTDDSTTVWSAGNPDGSHSSLAGPHFTFKDTEHTSKSLREQRSALAMELLWIQQAISSRKKYLTLRQRMDVSH